MTHPVEGPTGWIEHDGGECPLEPGAVIDVRYGDGEEAYGQKLHPGHGSWEWISAVPHETDVVAYRPVSTKPQGGDQGALQAQAPSVTTEQADGAVVADRGPIEHEVKCWPEPFAQVRSRAKPWELRRNDRDYRTGDTIKQREWSPDAGDYTGEIETHRIGWALFGPAFGLPDGYVIFTLEDPAIAKGGAL